MEQAGPDSLDDQVHVRSSSSPVAGEEGGANVNRHFFRCQKRLCEFFMWDPAEQAALGAQPGRVETQESADMEMEAEQKMNVEIGRIQQQQMQQQAAWMQSYMAQMNGGFEMVHPPQSPQ